MKTIALLHGPNLDRLGKREPEIYGTQSLADIESELVKVAESLDLSLKTFQSNHEGEIIDRLYQLADEGLQGVIFNFGALTHSSIALRDALASVALPCVEVHISNIYQREEFRHISYTAAIAEGVISGLGVEGYRSALRFLAQRLS